jgi:hypothetical protein
MKRSLSITSSKMTGWETLDDCCDSPMVITLSLNAFMIIYERQEQVERADHPPSIVEHHMLPQQPW